MCWGGKIQDQIDGLAPEEPCSEADCKTQLLAAGEAAWGKGGTT